MDGLFLKQEKIERIDYPDVPKASLAIEPIDILSSSESDSDSDVDDSVGVPGIKRSSALSDENGSGKKRKLNYLGVVLPVGFLDPLPLHEALPFTKPEPEPVLRDLPATHVRAQGCKQFWKAGDYVGHPVANSALSTVSAGMDHVRVHPKFLHSNATSHKWALGAFAELLDNSLDEVCNGATYVHLDVLENKKDKSRMLLVEDNGGGMDPVKLRQCMSLGYSAKSKLANTIGQYGNGFKTSTMRLGADVIVFSRCRGKDGNGPTQSIGLLSYTFLRSTGKEDIVVPMLDYEKDGNAWKNLNRLSQFDWNRNVETFVDWSPFFSEDDLLQEFNSMNEQGTRLIIYNLWEDDQGELELDFCADSHDIQLRGVNRDEKKIEMAHRFQNSKHFLTYQHSFRSYASILYLRLPPGFRMILRGKDVQHHNLVNDMMFAQEVTYRPAQGDGVPKDPNMLAVVTIGFVKDAKDHIDIQGFNVYHKNRLIKPFWRVWNAAGSDGRGVIAVLEADFVEPAHDKQGFERTTVLQRLEAKLVQMQKTYWSTNCQKIGYAPRGKKNLGNACSVKEVSPRARRQPWPGSHSSSQLPDADKYQHASDKVENGKTGSKLSDKVENGKTGSKLSDKVENGKTGSKLSDKVENGKTGSKLSKKVENGKTRSKLGVEPSTSQSTSEDTSEHDEFPLPEEESSVNKFSSSHKATPPQNSLQKENNSQLEAENCALKDRSKNFVESASLDLQIARDRIKSLEALNNELEQKLEAANKEQEALIDIFSEERSRREKEEENLRKKLNDASATIQELLDKVKFYSNNIKVEGRR